MAGGIVRYVPLSPPMHGAGQKTSSADWTICTSDLEAAINPKTRMIILNTPHNPIGKIFSRSELETITGLCLRHQIILLSDEVYDRLPYVPFTRPASLSAEVANLTLTVGSAGKSFYATGWRVGWLIGPEHLIKHVATAHRDICYASVSPLQEAAAVGFEEAEAQGFWEQSRADMKAKMTRFCAVLDELGLPYSEPEGGYFVLANFASVSLPKSYDWPAQVQHKPRDFKLAWWLIMELGVAAIPPTEFFTPDRKHIVEDWLRFAVCKDDAIIDAAKQRLRGLRQFIDAP